MNIKPLFYLNLKVLALFNLLHKILSPIKLLNILQFIISIFE